MDILITWIVGFIKIVFVLGTLITIHELGHFTVAKLCKVKVNKFAIGFGPKLFTKESKGTEYTLRLFPFGGFVQMEGEEERSEDKDAFNNKTVWQRIAIVAAGAVVNIVFALVVYFGIASSTNYYVSTVVEELNEGPLYEAGIREGDQIISINGNKVLTQREIETIIMEEDNDEMDFLVERNGEKIEIPVTLGYETRGYFGVGFSDSGEALYIYKNSPAHICGLQTGDLVTSINDETVQSAEEIVNIIRRTVNSNIALTVLRNNEEINLNATTEAKTERYYTLTCEAIEPGFIKGIPYALDETGYYFIATLKGTAEIFTGKAENVEVMGPVGIAGEISGTKAWSEFFYLMSAISLSLGIFNLLPVPALDGGRIFILLIEAVRRKPMKEKLEQGLILAGFAFIILLAVCITVSDVVKIF